MTGVPSRGKSGIALVIDARISDLVGRPPANPLRRGFLHPAFAADGALVESHAAFGLPSHGAD